MCDGYEAIDRRIAVLGDGPMGAREALFLRTYSPRVTLASVGYEPDAEARRSLEQAGIELLAASPDDITLSGDIVSFRDSRGGAARMFDHLYLALGCEIESRLALGWGAKHDAANNLLVDVHQETSIPRLYAAGDVVRGLNQIAVATAEAAIAATAIHNRLRCAGP